MTVPGPLLAQLKRMLSLDAAPASALEASLVVASHSRELARAVFEEAASSDDVTSAQSALEYFEDRMVALAPVVSVDVARDIRTEFEILLKAWA